MSCLITQKFLNMIHAFKIYLEIIVLLFIFLFKTFSIIKLFFNLSNSLTMCTMDYLLSSSSLWRFIIDVNILPIRASCGSNPKGVLMYIKGIG